MPGLAQLALGTAPIFGGATLAVAAGQFKGPDFRAVLKQDLDLLDRMPPDASPMFIVLILLSVVTAVYAMRGVLRAAATLTRGRRRRRRSTPR